MKQKGCVTIEIVAVMKASIVKWTKGIFFIWVGTSEGEDSSCEDSKTGVENEAGKKTIRDSKAATKHGHQPVFGE